MIDPDRQTLEWFVLTRSRPGEAIGGDFGVVALVPGGAMVAAIDGLGHGVDAAQAASAAGRQVTRYAGTDVIELMHQCHTSLRGTRGAAMSLGFLSSSDSTLTWMGVGNVAGRLLEVANGKPKREVTLSPLRGTPGHDLPPLRAATVSVRRGDLILFASDGIAASFADALDVSGSPRDIAMRIIDASWNEADDGLIVVIRWLQNQPGAQE